MTNKRNSYVYPVREPCSQTVGVDSGIKPSSASSDIDHRLKSVTFSNGVKTAMDKIVPLLFSKVGLLRNATISDYTD